MQADAYSAASTNGNTNFGVLSSAKSFTSSNLNSFNVGVSGIGDGGGNNYGGFFVGTGNSAANGLNIGVYGQFGSCGPAGSSLDAGIYGDVAVSACSNAWAGYFNGDVYSSTGVYASSDKKLKTNIMPLTNALDKLKLLKPSSYNFRIDEYKFLNLPKGSQMGLIAQDLEQVFPELVKVTTGNKNMKDPNSILTNFKSVNYIGLIPILIAGMQEQQNEIESLKQLISNSQKKANNSTGIVQVESSDDYYLEQNIPNPSKSETIINFKLPHQILKAEIIVSDLTGKLIQSYEIVERGVSSKSLNLEGYNSGIYLYSIVLDGKVIDSKKMIIQK